MPRKAFNFQSLFDTDSGIDYGSIGVAVNDEIRRAFLDLQDRPALKKGRKITICLELMPVCDEQGHLKQATLKADVDGRNPKRGIEVRLAAEHDGLEYVPESLDNPNQKTLYQDTTNEE